MGQLGEGRAVFGLPGPCALLSTVHSPLVLLTGADANTATQATGRDVLLIDVIPKEKTDLLSEISTTRAKFSRAFSFPCEE